MALVALKPGLFDVIQDLGRPGHRSRGVPPSGAFDGESFALANALLDNPENAAALEITLIGGEYLAEIPLAIALAGAPMMASILGDDGSTRPISIPQSAALRPGDRLRLASSPRGARTYLAVRGGWLAPVILGSRSRDEPLREGERLLADESTTVGRSIVEPPLPDPELGPIRILDGPEAISGWSWESKTYRITSRSDRMGLRLEGPSIPAEADPSRLSTPVTFGTIQVAGGQPLILGPSGGTMGGYPMLGQVISADLARLGQARPGSRIEFRSVVLEEARRLDREHRKRLADTVLRMATLVRGALSPQSRSPT